MLENLKKYSVILASNSSRRKQLLQRLGIKFKVRCLFGLDESYPENLTGEAISYHVARKKAEAYRSYMTAGELLITADTMVFLDDEVMGKPANTEEAIEMLHKLSGRTHKVITGVSVLTESRFETFTSVSEVTFDNLEESDIQYYVNNYLPFDKAGGYGIQEWIGMVAVKDIRGSYFNVMGLPVQHLYALLKTF